MMLHLPGPWPLLLLLLLLLLLGSWGPVPPAAAQPPGVTAVQWFITEHVRAGPVRCSTEMPQINYRPNTCKGQNTFLQESFQNVVATCQQPNRTCKNGLGNCHQSAGRVNMTYCLLTGRQPQCTYRTTYQNQFYIVACNNSQPGYPPNLLLPIHLDDTVPLGPTHFG